MSWIEKVRIDIKGALTDRVVFRRFNDVLRENRVWIAEHHGARFCEFMATTVEAFVDKKLAHLDRKGVPSRATFSDLDNAPGAVGRNFRRAANQAPFSLVTPA